MTISLIIAGSRGVFPSLEQIDREVARLPLSWPEGWDPNHPDVSVFARVIDEEIDGGAPGADDAGGRWGLARGISVHNEPITEDDVRRYGKWMAPKHRNRRMAERGQMLVAFWDGVSAGTTHMTTLMVLRRKYVQVVPTKRASPRPKRRPLPQSDLNAQRKATTQ